MSIVKMKRLRIVSPATKTEGLLRRLASLGFVELNEPSSRDMFLEVIPPGDLTREFSLKKAAVKSAIDALSAYAEKKSLFAMKPEISESELLSADFTEVYECTLRINAVTEKIAANESAGHGLILSALALKPWEEAGVPLDFTGGGYYTAVFFTVPASESAEPIISAVETSTLPAQVLLVNSDRNFHYMYALAHKHALGEVWDILKTYGALRVNPGFTGTAEENAANIAARSEHYERENAALREELSAFAARLPELERYYDRLSIDETRASVYRNLILTQNAAFMEGWIPSAEEGTVKTLLESLGCAYEIAEPVYDEDDENTQPPVAFHNSKFVSRFSFITQLYGMPKYSSVIDPNPFVTPFFLVFFGIMMADVGYGVLFALTGFILIKKYRPKGFLDNVLHLMLYGGVSMAVWGVLLGAWFGDVVTHVSRMITGTAYTIPPVLFDPMTNPIPMLVMCMGLGILHIFTGMALDAWRKIKKGQVFDAICDDGFWYLVITGIILYAVGIKPGLYMLLGGVAGILIFGGRHKKNLIGKLTGGLSSLYGISGYLSDVLSYSRLLALGLTSGVVASVMNTLAATAGFSVPGVIMFIIVFIIGHAFNIVINILGGVVHALRLQYIEFFSRFFEGGGRQFNPIINKTKYINIKE